MFHALIGRFQLKSKLELNGTTLKPENKGNSNFESKGDRRQSAKNSERRKKIGGF